MGNRIVRRSALFLILTLILVACGGKQNADTGGSRAGAKPTATPLISTPSGEARPLTLGLHLSIDILAGYDYVEGKWWDTEDWERNMPRNIEWMANAGYDTLLVDTMGDDGEYYFLSSTLEEQGYLYSGFDLLRPLMDEARKYDITVYADITGLAWRILDPTGERYGIPGNPLTVEQVQQVVYEIVEGYGVEGVIEETFLPEYVTGLYEACQQADCTYIRKQYDITGDYDIIMSEDYVGYADNDQLAEILDEKGVLATNLGVMTAVFSHARAIDKPAWVKVYGGWDFSPGGSRNVFYLRAVQFQSDGYFWMDFTSNPNYEWLINMDTEGLRRWLEYLRTPPGPRPIANIYVDWPDDKTLEALDTDTSEETEFMMEMSMTETYGPVANGLLMAGYDVQTTYDEPIVDAELIVVIVPGVIWNDPVEDLSNTALNLLKSDSNVILIPAAVPGDGKNWQKGYSLLGISPDWTIGYTETGMPETAALENQLVRWQGYPIWGYPPTTSLIRPQDVTGEALVTMEIDDEDVVLITRKENKVLINGNLLNLDTSYIFNRLAADLTGKSPRLLEPFYGYGIVGTRSAFLAAEDDTINVALHYDDGTPIPRGARIRLLPFSADGAFMGYTDMNYEGSLQYELARHELLIVELAE